MSGVIALLCWGAFIAWLGRHEFGIARDTMRRRREARQSAEALGECFTRMRLYPTSRRDVQSAPVTLPTTEKGTKR